MFSIKSGGFAPNVLRLRACVHPAAPSPATGGAEFQERCRKPLKQLEILDAGRPHSFTPRMSDGA